MEFFKYHGAGNDFVLIDQRGQIWLDRSDTHRIAHLCHRHFGIGADGLILLQHHDALDFEMIYFNADGLESSMCGNGGRCIAAFARHQGLNKPLLRFWAIDGLHEALMRPSTGAGEEWVELKMADVDQISVSEHSTVFVLNTGSPHYVRFVPELNGLDVVQAGRAIRYSEAFRAKGINVNLVQEENGYLTIRTYERGVEDETLACGTGVTAAALAFFQRYSQKAGKSEIDVHARGGNLQVRFEALGNGIFRNIWLCGPAKKVFQGAIDLE